MSFCEKCNDPINGPGIYVEHHDEFWCDNCTQSAAEAAYERQCEDFHDGGSTAPWPETVRLQQEAARRLK